VKFWIKILIIFIAIPVIAILTIQYFGTQLDSALRLPSAANIISIVVGGLDLLGAFIFYSQGRRDTLQNAIQEKITTHSRKIVEDLREHRSKRDNIGWSEVFRDFRYRTELIQHLYTGHKVLYSSLQGVFAPEKKEAETHDSVSTKLRTRIKTEVSRIGVENTPESNTPRFNAESVTEHVLRDIDINQWKGFEFKRDRTGARCIVTSVESFQIFGFDQKLADQFVVTINSIFNDPDLIKNIQAYQESRKEMKVQRKSFDDELDRLLGGIDLTTKNFEGSCDQCVGLYDNERQKKFSFCLCYNYFCRIHFY
jgi:hypothetical protein